MPEEPDETEIFPAGETGGKLPVGWLVLFWGLVVWGVCYFVLYTPALSGWTQERSFQESLRK